MDNTCGTEIEGGLGSKTIKSVLRISAGVLGLLLLIATGLYLTARVMPIPLAPVAVAFQAGLATVLGGTVEVRGAELVWSEEQGRLIIAVDRIHIEDRDGAAIDANHIAVAFSTEAIWREQRFAIVTVNVAEAVLTPSRYASLPVQTEVLFDSGVGENANSNAFDYFESFAVRNIVFSENELVGDAFEPSEILLLRKGRELRGTAKIAYRRKGKDTRVDARASLIPGDKGELDVTFDGVNPRDIGLFSRFLAPLQALQLPVSGDFHVDFDASLSPTVGAFNLFVEPGAILLSQTVVPVHELSLGLDADFGTRRVAIRDGRFNIAGVGGALGGTADFEQKNNALHTLSFSLDGTGIIIDRPTLFENKLSIARAEALLAYDVAEAKLTIDRLTLTHSYGEAETSGQIFLANNQPIFDIVVGFGAMSRAAVTELWPTPVAPRARKWVDDNIQGGSLKNGTLALRATLDELTMRERGTPLREEALTFDLNFDKIDIRYLSHLPPLRQTNAEMSLRGTSFRATAVGGTIDLPVSATEMTNKLMTRPVDVERTSILLPDFRAKGAPAEISLRADGRIADVVRALQRPPLNVARNVDFDFDRISGSAKSNVAFNLPLIVAKGELRPVQFKVEAVARDVDIDGKLGPYELRGAQAHVRMNNSLLEMQGTGQANGVALGFNWQQPLQAEKADKARLAINGRVTPQNIADLGQGWAGVRLVGDTRVNVLVNGPIAKPSGFRVHADLTEAVFAPRPLAYEKPAETPAYIEAAIKNSNGEVEQIRARLHIDGDEVLATQLNFQDGILRKARTTPINLGKTRNFEVKITPQDVGSFVNITADVFDAGRVFATANKEVALPPEKFSFLPFLGPDFVIEGRLGEVVGAHDASIEETRLRLFRKNGLHEEAWLEGVFSDGSDLLASIERTSAVSRSFSFQTENAGNVFRLFDWVEGVYGGSLSVQGDMYDTGYDSERNRRDLSGRMTLVSFRARNVGVLAQILSLASLTGIADTLSGDGIKFNKAKGNFSITDGRLNISGAQVNGPAVGLTAKGDFDLVSGDTDIGGTLVPAYSLNSFLGKIPLVGGILGSRDGEGLIGIGYRIAGDGGDVGVLVNPLSILTPGVFRRIFEIGIGLPGRNSDPVPNISVEPKSGLDGAIE